MLARRSACSRGKQGRLHVPAVPAVDRMPPACRRMRQVRGICGRCRQAAGSSAPAGSQSQPDGRHGSFARRALDERQAGSSPRQALRCGNDLDTEPLAVLMWMDARPVTCSEVHSCASLHSGLSDVSSPPRRLLNVSGLARTVAWSVISSGFQVDFRVHSGSFAIVWVVARTPTKGLAA